MYTKPLSLMEIGLLQRLRVRFFALGHQIYVHRGWWKAQSPETKQAIADALETQKAEARKAKAKYQRRYRSKKKATVEISTSKTPEPVETSTQELTLQEKAALARERKAKQDAEIEAVQTKLRALNVLRSEARTKKNQPR